VLVSQPIEVTIPERLPESTIELDVTEINAPGAGGSSPASAAPADDPGAPDDPALPILVDIGVEFPRQLFVRGRGLDSEWRGALQIAGSADAPRITGGLELVRGRFAFIDKTFDLQSGTINFDGSDPPNPDINLVAEVDADDVLARIIVSGRASAIDIALESEPALPRDEILARVLFGKSASEISAFQAAQLAQTAASLSGSGGFDIMGKVREVIGVDDISVSTDGDGASGAALGVGKYVADGVYLRAQQGFGRDSSRAGVEVEITDSITVEGDVGANAESSTWLNWLFRY
jgi:translocation and assembly module TamB